uniref:Uncharacterized protein n=1 Tax=Romanomermis culicivorax TaxID=13658 RepID=A0A915JZ00_ROMCU
MIAPIGRDVPLRQNEKSSFYGRSFVHSSSKREKFDDRRRAPYYYDDYYKRRRYDNYDRERSHRRMEDWRYRK